MFKVFGYDVFFFGFEFEFLLFEVVLIGDEIVSEEKFLFEEKYVISILYLGVGFLRDFIGRYFEIRLCLSFWL